jgi:hypothetical protein
MRRLKLWMAEKAGRGSLAGLSKWQRLEAATGRVAPAAIEGSQAVGGIDATTVPPSIVAGANQKLDNSDNR